MGKFMYMVAVVWMILWILFTFWSQIFMSPGNFLSVGMVSVIIVAVITWIGAPDLEITFEDDDKE